jgi:hypothetical protein
MGDVPSSTLRGSLAQSGRKVSGAEARLARDGLAPTVADANPHPPHSSQKVTHPTAPRTRRDLGESYRPPAANSRVSDPES